MKESFSIKQETVVSSKPANANIYDTTYCRYEGDYEGVEVEYSGGLALIYFQDRKGSVSADIHYDPKTELPNKQSLGRLLNDAHNCVQDMISGNIVIPDRLTVHKEGNRGLTNMFRKQLNAKSNGDRLVVTVDQEEKVSQLTELASTLSGLLNKF